MDEFNTLKAKQFCFGLLIIFCLYVILRLFFFNKQVVDIEIYNTKTNMENFQEKLKYTIFDEDENILDERLSSDQNILLQPSLSIGKINTYYVTQQSGTTPNTIYDNSIYKLEISTGWLFSTAEIKIYKDDVQVDQIIFNNVYNENCEVAIIECEALLTFDGNNDSTYGLIDEENIIVAKSTVNKDGKVIFQVPIEEEGEYEFRLRDITDTEGHIKDAHDFRVMVSAEILSRRLKTKCTFYEGEMEIPKVVFGSGYNWEEKTIKVPIFNATKDVIIFDDYWGSKKELSVGENIFEWTSMTPNVINFYCETENHKYQLILEFINNNTSILETKHYLIKDGNLMTGDILID